MRDIIKQSHSALDKGQGDPQVGPQGDLGTSASGPEQAQGSPRSRRRCWTCHLEHDLDEACPASSVVRSMRSAGGPGNELADHTSPHLTDDLTDEADDVPDFGPIFTATYDGEDDCCGAGIEAGEQARSDGQGGWIHATAECERLARS